MRKFLSPAAPATLVRTPHWLCSKPAERELGWKTWRGLDEMMRDAWRWQSMNPDGYR